MDANLPVAGSPLIPIDLIAGSLLVFALVLVGIHLFVKKRHLTLKIGLVIFSLLTTTVVALGFYWLIPAPQIIKTLPAGGQTNANLNSKIEIVFNRPVSRKMLEKSIQPEVAGVWVFEGSVYKTHLMRKAVFYPLETLMPNTEYKVTLSKILNTIRNSKEYDYEFSFKTKESPKVVKIEPANEERNVSPDTKINISLNAQSEGSIYSFEILPKIPFSVDLDESKTIYILSPKVKFKQAAHYEVKVYKSDIKSNLETGEVIESSPIELVHNSFFSTIEPAGIQSIFPSGTNVSSRQPVTIRFTNLMDMKSVMDNFSVEPKIAGELSSIDDIIFVFTPKKYDYDTTYTIKLGKSAKSLDGAYLTEDVISSFTTIGRVGIENASPGNGGTGIDVNAPIKITFNQDVDVNSFATRFLSNPQIEGDIEVQSRTLIFTPEKPLNPDTQYTLTLKSGIRGLDGLDSDADYTISFATVQNSFRLPVPAYLQQYPLSCETASLRMALAYRNIKVTEDELLNLIGFDTTPHIGNIWGNPNQAFVGNARGKQMTTGYGVHWGPIARVAKNYREAKEFSGWSIGQVTTEVKKGNPVIIWGYSKSGKPTSWSTPSGEKIRAVSGEHTYVIAGFVGPAENPTHIIVNDSLFGQIHLSRAAFDQKWASLGNSGVVVF